MLAAGTPTWHGRVGRARARRCASPHRPWVIHPHPRRGPTTIVSSTGAFFSRGDDLAPQSTPGRGGERGDSTGAGSIARRMPMPMKTSTTARARASSSAASGEGEGEGEGVGGGLDCTGDTADISGGSAGGGGGSPASSSTTPNVANVANSSSSSTAPRTIKSLTGTSTRATRAQQRESSSLTSEGEESESDPEIVKPHNRTARARGGSKKAANAGEGSSSTGGASAHNRNVKVKMKMKMKRRGAEARQQATTTTTKKSSARRRSGGESRNATASGGGGGRRNFLKDMIPPLLDAEQERRYGADVQALLRVEATEQELVEESIAEELRREKLAAWTASAGGGGGGGEGEGDGEKAGVIIDDIFSKDFGKTKKKTTKKGGGRGGGGRSRAGDGGGGGGIGIGRDRSSPAFRRELARCMGFRNVGQLNTVVDRGRAARQALVEHNVGLAFSIAEDIHDKLRDADKGLLAVQDLAMEGCAGLARAADKFDPARGYRFSTYAYHWTRKAVLDSINNNGRTIRLPIHLCELVQRSKAVTRKLEHELGRAPNDEELAARLGVTKSRVQELGEWSKATISLDFAGRDGRGDDGDGSFSDALTLEAMKRGDIVPGASGSGGGGIGLGGGGGNGMGGGGNLDEAEADVEADLLRYDLEEAFSTLLPREAFVLRHRFGLSAASAAAMNVADAVGGGGSGDSGWLQATEEQVEETLRAARGSGGIGNGGTGPVVSRQVLGSLLGVSFETVKTIERRAVAKLKQPQRAALILPYLPPDAAERLKGEMGKNGASKTKKRMGRPKKKKSGEEEKDESDNEDSAEERFAKALAAAIKSVDERAGGGRVLGGRGRVLQAAAAAAGGGNGDGRKGTPGTDGRRTARRRRGRGGGGTTTTTTTARQPRRQQQQQQTQEQEQVQEESQVEETPAEVTVK